MLDASSPPYLKDVSEATVDEDLEFVVERLSSFPRFTAIEKNWFNILSCEPGRYFDPLTEECTDCVIACHLPKSADCQHFCPGWSKPSTEILKSTFETPYTSVVPAVAVSVTIGVIAILAIVAIVAIVVYKNIVQPSLAQHQDRPIRQDVEEPMVSGVEETALDAEEVLESSSASAQHDEP
ncbi:hypothetical protein LSAT2_013148 [Lamellibrachia satsuma]|nr:hypothetical protein LSAT2_013148 [Lamellibrachia satsuma]